MELLAPVQFGETMARIVPQLPRLGASGSPARGGSLPARNLRRLTASSASSSHIAEAAFGQETTAEDAVSGSWAAGAAGQAASYIARCYLENQLAFVVPQFSFFA